MSNKTLIWVLVVAAAVGAWFFLAGKNAPEAPEAMTAQEAGLDGLHIMADGSLMLGDGSMVETATVNEDGMVVLENGDLVQPEMDLRNASETEIEGHLEALNDDDEAMEDDGAMMEDDGEMMVEGEVMIDGSMEEGQ
jgi:hypothetical protein